MVKAAEVATDVTKESVNWGEAVLIFILGIGTVFAVLIILWAILALMKVIFAKTSVAATTAAPKAAPAPQASAPKQSSLKMSTPKKVATSAPQNEDELVALLNGAVAAYAGTTNLRVKSYKKM